MATAVILLNVEGKETTRVAEAIASLAGVTEVYSVAGNYDLVAIVRVHKNEALAELVTDQIRAIPGILGSQTLIAFRAYSPKDVDALFDMD
ncbi:MAG TPA: Lrp/AsnC ligand binding domain-containing protein [Steroidobacteraceae bacterium]|jgi:DNA-binding Lrp family transcriptional regulator|nr:Lrp/AsnC ligand binding domain-containing protein [Steroidobacteraceae bacterium]